MASRSSVGHKAINNQAFEPSLGSSAILTGSAAANGTVAVTANQVYRVANATSTAMYVGFDTIYNSGLVSTAAAAAIVSGYQDIIVPPTKSVLHYTGAGVLVITLHAE